MVRSLSKEVYTTPYGFSSGLILTFFPVIFRMPAPDKAKPRRPNIAIPANTRVLNMMIVPVLGLSPLGGFVFPSNTIFWIIAGSAAMESSRPRPSVTLSVSEPPLLGAVVFSLGELLLRTGGGVVIAGVSNPGDGDGMVACSTAGAGDGASCSAVTSVGFIHVLSYGGIFMIVPGSKGLPLPRSGLTATRRDTSTLKRAETE